LIQYSIARASIRTSIPANDGDGSLPRREFHAQRHLQNCHYTL